MVRVGQRRRVVVFCSPHCLCNASHSSGGGSGGWSGKVESCCSKPKARRAELQRGAWGRAMEQSGPVSRKWWWRVWHTKGAS